MPDRIQTAQLIGVDSETLEINDSFPGTYGFYARLSRDPGPEWAAEFEGTYAASPRSAKPPIVFRGDTLCVYFLPVYSAELAEFMGFLEGVIIATNQAVEQRNAVLPDDHTQREAFRAALEAVAQSYRKHR